MWTRRRLLIANYPKKKQRWEKPRSGLGNGLLSRTVMVCSTSFHYYYCNIDPHIKIYIIHLASSSIEHWEYLHCRILCDRMLRLEFFHAMHSSSHLPPTQPVAFVSATTTADNSMTPAVLGGIVGSAFGVIIIIIAVVVIM